MAHNSYGEDLYSPLRFHGSLNDTSVSNADGSPSDVYGSSFGARIKKENRSSLETIQDEDCEQQTGEATALSQAPSEKNSRSKRPTNLPIQKSKANLTPRLLDDAFSPVKQAHLDPEPPKQEKITPVKSPRPPRSKKQTDERQETTDKQVSNRRSKTGSRQFINVTVRGESNRSKSNTELPVTIVSDLIQLGDSTEKNLGRSNECPSVVVSDLVRLSDNNEMNLGRLDVSSRTGGVDCSTQTDLTMTDLQILLNKADLKPSGHKRGAAGKKSSEDSLSVNLPTRLQANTLEKLKDTVEDEFHGVRMQLYQMQLVLGKLLYDNLDGTNDVIMGLNNVMNFLKDDQQLQMAALLRRFNS